MGRTPCCDKANVKRGPWSPGEDAALLNYIQANGTGGSWIALPHKAGLKRCGKSCRLRWLNYLRPGIKNGGYSEEEENIIYSLYNNIGSRWSVIAAQLPGRTDNDVKNYWNTKLKRKLLAGKTSLNNNNNINSHKKIHLSTTNSPASLAEAGNHNDDSWVCSSTSSTRVPLQMEVGYTEKITDPQGLVSSPIFSPSWKPTEGSNNNYSVSLSQGVSSISGSSSLALDSDYMMCYDNRSLDYGILMGFSFEPPYDLLHGFGSEEISSELALSPNYLHNSPHSSLLANGSDTTP